MRFPTAVVAVIALALHAAPALAASWVLIDKGSIVDVEIDTQSIVPAGGGLIKAWVSHSYSEVQKLRAFPNQEYKSAVQLQYYNCAERTSGVLQQVFYSEQGRLGKVVHSDAYQRKNLELIDVVPDSIGEGTLMFACSANKKQKKQ